MMNNVNLEECIRKCIRRIEKSRYKDGWDNTLLIDTNEFKDLKEQLELKMQTTDTKIPMPEVKEPKKSIGKLTVEVETKGLDESLEKARELVGVLERIDGLTGRIARDIDKINRYTLGK